MRNVFENEETVKNRTLEELINSISDLDDELRLRVSRMLVEAYESGYSDGLVDGVELVKMNTSEYAARWFG